MAKYSKEQELVHKEYIRAFLVMNPHITIFETQAIIQKKYALKLDKDYINKLLKSVLTEKAQEKYNHTKNKVFSYFKDESDLAKRFLWDVANDTNNPKNERMTALKEIRNWSNSLLDRMIDANILSSENIEITDSDKFYQRYANMNPEQIEEAEKELDKKLASLERELEALEKKSA